MKIDLPSSNNQSSSIKFAKKNKQFTDNIAKRDITNKVNTQRGDNTLTSTTSQLSLPPEGQQAQLRRILNQNNNIINKLNETVLASQEYNDKNIPKLEHTSNLAIDEIINTEDHNSSDINKTYGHKDNTLLDTARNTNLGQQDINTASRFTDLNKKREIKAQERRHRKRIMDNEHAFMKQLRDQSNKHKTQMKYKEIDLKQRYQKLVSNYKNAMKNMQGKFSKAYNQILASNKNDLRIASKISETPFYQVSTLAPLITDNVDHYLLMIQVGEHEKDKFTLSGNDRTIRLSFARDFADEFNDNQGGTHKTKRSEAIMKEFQVADLLDFNKVSATWQGDQLLYKIPKA